MRRNKLLTSLASSAIIMVALLAPAALFAQSPTEYTPLTAIPYLTAPEEGKATINPLYLIKNIYGVSIAIAAVLAVAMIIYAGLKYSTEEAFTGKSDAKETWQNAIIGLLLLLSAWVILRTINVDLVNVNLELGSGDLLKCKPARNDNGVLVPCEVDGKALSQLYDTASRAAAKLQLAQDNLAGAEKVLEGLKAKRVELENAIAAEGDSAEAAELRNQLENLDKEIAAANLVVGSKRIDSAREGMNLAAAQLNAQTMSDALKAIKREEVGGAAVMTADQALAEISVAKRIALTKFDAYANSFGDKKTPEITRKLNFERSAVENMADQSAALIRASFTLNAQNTGVNDRMGPLNTALNIINGGVNIPLANLNPELYGELIRKSENSKAMLLEIAKTKCPTKNAVIGDSVKCIN